MKIKNSNIPPKGIEITLWHQLPHQTKALVRAIAQSKAPAKAKAAKAPKPKAEDVAIAAEMASLGRVILVIRESTARSMICTGHNNGGCGLAADTRSTRGYCEGHMREAARVWNLRHR